MGQRAGGLPAEKEEKTPMKPGKFKQTQFPPGWNEGKVKKVLAVYESQNEDDAALEDEEGMKASETVMRVPHELVPVFRELIAKRRAQDR